MQEKNLKIFEKRPVSGMIENLLTHVSYETWIIHFVTLLWHFGDTLCDAKFLTPTKSTTLIPPVMLKPRLTARLINLPAGQKMNLRKTRKVLYQSIRDVELITNMTKLITFENLNDQKSGLKWSKMTEINVNKWVSSLQPIFFC